MADEEHEDEENTQTVVGEATLSGGASLSATVSYSSGFPKQQLAFAKRARDKVGKIEAVFGGENSDKISDFDNREHQRNTVSAVVNSIGFLEGQKYWFIYRLEEHDWGFDNIEDIQETGWNGTEDAFVRMLEVSGGNSDILKDTPPYHQVKTFRKFRNNLLHFESPTVRAGDEPSEYEVDQRLSDHGYPENPIAPNNTYPFKWFSHELAESAVRYSYTFWRFFGRGLDMEDEFLKGVPSP